VTRPIRGPREPIRASDGAGEPIPGPVLAVLGPTAAGKSDLGVALAEAVGGEVVNADSMQLYRGMDIGTAKLTPAERRGVPHHLLDVWPVTETASVAAYQSLARAAVASVLARGRVPVLVGGSGLYVRAVLDDLRFPGTDPTLRGQLEAELAAAGAPALHARLATLDPDAARDILPTNGRRIVRALEVVELTGGPFTATLPAAATAVYDAVQVGVDRPPAALDARIVARVDRMWTLGFVDEVRRLIAAGLAAGPTASRALGYRQILAALAGAGTLDEARAETVRATRRFARRQRSWFRRDPRVTWLDGGSPALLADALALAARRLQG
jgi:tRNA dimethylallyltransferase